MARRPNYRFERQERARAKAAKKAAKQAARAKAKDEKAGLADPDRPDLDTRDPEADDAAPDAAPAED